MAECKTVKDMEDRAHELLRNVLDKSRKTVVNGKITLDFDSAFHILAWYLLDAYNDGYDDAVVSQCPRRYKID